MNEKWSESAKSIIEMGKYLAELKPKLGPKELNKKARADYGISNSSVNKLIKLSQHPILSNPEYADKLPPAWGTLYELNFIPHDILLEKLGKNELATASKYQVWEWRGVKAKRSDSSSNQGGRVKVPDNISLVAYVNVGIQKEPEFNGDIEAAAECIGVGSATYRKIRQIILLSQHPDLSNSDSALVQSIIDKINKSRNIRPYYRKVKPLIDKIWGPSRNKKLTGKNHSKRVEVYLNSIFLLGISAQRLADMERPYMSVEDTDKSISELSEAGTIIRKLAETLRRSKDD